MGKIERVQSIVLTKLNRLAGDLLSAPIEFQLWEELSDRLIQMSLPFRDS